MGVIFLILLTRTLRLRGQGNQTLWGIWWPIFAPREGEQSKVLDKHQGKIVNSVAETNEAWPSEDQRILLPAYHRRKQPFWFLKMQLIKAAILTLILLQCLSVYVCGLKMSSEWIRFPLRTSPSSISSFISPCTKSYRLCMGLIMGIARDGSELEHEHLGLLWHQEAHLWINAPALVLGLCHCILFLGSF